MVFSSSIFLFVFLPTVLILYYFPMGSRLYRNMILLLSSLLFYAWGEPVFVFVMIISIIITWILGLMIGKQCMVKLFLMIGIIYHVIVLFIFKYLSFVSSQFGVRVNISLPIGISFFTFQMMSYLFDVYYKKAQVQKNPLYVGLYVTLFPQLIAGPIVRYERISTEIDNRHESYRNVVSGMQTFIYGLAKKVLIANYVAQIADNVFDYLAGNTTIAMVWLGAISYTLQIYYDFSGYSDMAIGIGRMFGFHFEENFNYPYISRSVTEFWRRWHISLSSWFRDYVYIPLGGNRVSNSKWLLNFFIVWLLTGIWHGANWTFIVWGFLYCVVLIVEKKKAIATKLGKLSYIYTMIVVIIAWVVFRSNSLSSALVYIENMFGIGSTGIYDSAVTSYLKSSAYVLIFSCIGVTPFVKQLFEKMKDTKFYFVETIWIMLIFILSLIQVVSSTYNPFIYYNF